MKKFLSMLLAVMMSISIFASCGEDERPEDTITYQTKSSNTTSEKTTIKETTADTTETNGEPIVNNKTWFETASFQNGWRYQEIDLSDCQYYLEKSVYTPGYGHVDYIGDGVNKCLGYKKGTYEYQYFRALIGISYYAAIADHRLWEDPSFQNQLVDIFLKNNVDPAYFQEPYEDILYECFTLLKEANIRLYEVTIYETYEYGMSFGIYYSEHRYHPSEWSSRLALLFADIDTKLTEYATDLLNLSKNDSSYQGDFVITETMKETAQAIIKACEPVETNRVKMMEAWGAYYSMRLTDIETELQYKIIPEKATIKITLITEGEGFFFGNETYPDPEDDIMCPWVKDLNGYIVLTNKQGDYYHIEGPNPSPAIIYMPLRYFFQQNGEVRFFVCDEFGNKYEMMFRPNVNFDKVEGTSVKLEDPFLDAALTKHFGGEYRDIDLCKISSINIRYYVSGDSVDSSNFRTPTVVFTFHDEFGGGSASYRYYDLFGKNFSGEKPIDIKYSVLKFPCLEKVAIFGITEGSGHSIFEEAELEFLLKGNPYTPEDFE